MLYTNNGVLLILKKKGNSDNCCNADVPWQHYVKWNQLGTKGQILYYSTYMTYLELSNSQSQKAEWGSQELTEGDNGVNM